MVVQEVSSLSFVDEQGPCFAVNAGQKCFEDIQTQQSQNGQYYCEDYSCIRRELRDSGVFERQYVGMVVVVIRGVGNKGHVRDGQSRISTRIRIYVSGFYVSDESDVHMGLCTALRRIGASEIACICENVTDRQ